MNDILLIAPDLVVLGQTGGFFSQFLENNALIQSLVQAGGVILLLMVLGKFVWDKRKGQGGGQGGGLGQIALGVLAAAAIFVPTFLGTVVDTGINVATSVLQYGSAVFTDTTTVETITDPTTGNTGNRAGARD